MRFVLKTRIYLFRVYDNSFSQKVCRVHDLCYGVPSE